MDGSSLARLSVSSRAIKIEPRTNRWSAAARDAAHGPFGQASRRRTTNVVSARSINDRPRKMDASMP